MSVLALPRFHFAGSWTVNPCTTNNDDVNLFNDYTYMDIVNQPSNIKTDAEFRQYMMQLKPNEKDPRLNNILLNAGWNYFGDNTLTFESATLPATKVMMSCLPNGAIVKDGDALIGASVSLKGNAMGDNLSPAVMVDLDPASNYSAQIFASYFQIEIPDGQGGKVTVLSNTKPEFMPMYARYMTLSRNVSVHGDTGCSVIWQFGISKDNLTLNQAVNSPTLRAFQQAMADPKVQGILVQFDCYLVTHTYSGPVLHDEFFAKGIEKENPAYGPIVGTVGLWYEGEMDTEPSASGRVLYPVVSFDPANPVSPRLPNLPDVPVMGQAMAAIDPARQVVVLNLANTLPETGMFTAEKPFGVKYQYGNGRTDLELMVGYIENGTYQTQHLAYLPYVSGLSNPYTEYRTESYIQTGGIVELSYAGSAGAPYIDKGQLILVYQKTPFLGEINYSNLMSNQFGIYVNEGETIDVTLRAEYQGHSARSPINLEEWRCIVVQGKDEPCYSNALSYEGFVTCQFTFPADAQYPNILSFPSQVMTGEDGNVTISVKALNPGISFIRLIPAPPAQNNGLNHRLWQLATLNQSDPNSPYNTYPSWQYDMYMAIRVLPLDTGYNDPTSPDYISDEALVGEDGFNNYLYPLVFRYYYLMYPGMSKHINFSSYREMKANANIIKTFVRKGNMDNTLYMPITRELSDGKRLLIQRWCAVNE